ncbi:ABC transporter permease [Roseomonas sp. GC11]|uniref:ABC transporter permease n=1 Tax=Roseomonas sp. GC11 TaxID=2950546 RepID=UPI00210CDBB3|nr:ABC transporter permease [Roseomonas sp. GC11]MCQ4159054.1 ABC transporter permease [Roseomonas sp. GC11]
MAGPGALSGAGVRRPLFRAWLPWTWTPWRWIPWTWIPWGRLAQLAPVLFGIATLNFLILQLAPGDVVDVLSGEAGAATPETMAELRRSFGLDQPLPVQYLRYLGHLASFDLGHSYRLNMPVRELILTRLPPTLLLMLSALVLAVSLGALAGLLAARHAGRWPDLLLSGLTLLSYALPTFWLGLMAIVLFSARLGWLPSGGMLTIGAGHAGLAWLRDLLAHLVLPALTLSTFYLAVYARLVRSAMLELHGADFIRTARAKGAGEWRITLRHAFRNALLPMVTMAGYQAASLLSGAVLVETVFSWPGLGRLAYEAIRTRDLNLLLGILFFSSILVVIVNLGIDGLYRLVDPRVTTGARRI